MIELRMVMNNNEIPVCRILGVQIAAVSMEKLVKYLQAHRKELQGQYICVSNVHTTVMAYEDIAYRSVQNGAVLAIPDGGPLSSVAHRRGYMQMQRTTGPDLMEEIFKISVNNGYRHFFYGSTEETLEHLKTNLETKYPGIQISGMFSPPFRELTMQEDRKIISLINNAHPDFVWVGLGAPKQELWMAAHQGKIQGLMVGVGAGFNYHAGELKRAPQWMQRCNLEWLYRLLQDPRRLFKRYFTTNTKFIWNAYIKGR